MKRVGNELKKLTPQWVALLYFVLAASWILASTYLVTFTAQDPYHLARLELLKGLLFVLVTSGLLYLLLSAQRSNADEKSPSPDTRPVRTIPIIGLFIALTLTVPLLGFAITRIHGPQVEQEALERLSIVARLKSEHIERWMHERESDAAVLGARNSEFVRSVERLAAADDATGWHREYVVGKLQNLRVGYHYSALLLLDRQLDLLAADGDETELAAETLEAVRAALASGKIARTNLYKVPSQRIYLDWVVPVSSVVPGQDDIVAAVILRTSPETVLYPMISTWPGISETAENVLIRQQGGEVLYLSELQHKKGTALAMRLPMDNRQLPAAVALRENKPGTTRGTDYMGQEVLAAYHPVAATDWRLVTKINHAEVLAPLWNMTLLVSGIAFVFIIAISMTLLLVWRQQSRMQSLLALAHKSESEKLFQHFFDMPFVGMAVISPANKTLENFNDYLCEIIGYSREELMGRSCLEFTHPDDVEADVSEFSRILDGSSDGYVMEKRFFRKDGSEIVALVDTKCIRNQDGSVRYLFATAQDITRHKVDEARIQRLSRLYSVLSQCNQSIVRLTSEQTLYDKICETAVTEGCMRMAWIGMINAETSMVEPVASFGDDIGYLDNIQISCDAASPYGNGPTGVAIRQNQPYWCQDYSADMILAPWAQKSAGMWGSSAAIPITRGSVVAGTLNIYASEKNAFDEDAKGLLVEMAVDIGFALDNFDKEGSRSIAEALLMESESKFHLLFDQSPDGLLIIDREEIIECNSAAIDLIDGSPAEILHARPWAFAPDFQPDGVSSEEKMQEMLDVTKDKGRCRFEWMHRRSGMADIPLEVTMVAITLKGRQVFYSTWRNISEQKNAEARIRYLAQYDVLTNLPNRTLLTDRVNQAINIAQRNQQNLSVMFFDLDRFKNINDSLGHGTGDELLIQVSKRLQAVVREQDTVSRLGGDEFVILLLDTSEEGAARVAKKLMAAASEPYHIDHHEITITSSIGIAVFPDDGKNFDDLLKSADIAMYRAKRSGRNNYHFFTMKMQEDTLRVMQLTAALHQAIELNQLSLNFQPQLSLHDGSVIGAEVLLRWQHPDFGPVSPVEFIPLAEDTGDILRIGEWVLQQTIRQLKKWHRQGMPGLKLAVNLSAVQFRHPHLPDLISQLLDDEDLAAEYLELELTESVSMDDPAAAVEMMNKLAGLGVRMSIDDFGTGYSSLSYLKRFKAYKLKIDQSFVRDIMVDVDDRAIVQSIITLAKSLGMKTIAEGVETQEQMDFLRRCECDELQGYHFSHPLTAAGFEKFHKKHRPEMYVKTG